MKEKLYNLPKYYDIAFSWDISRETAIFRELFKRHTPFKVKNILEPACKEYFRARMWNWAIPG
jgi:hypothetical protein